MSLLEKAISSGGACYGMASSSIMYFRYPNLLPSPYQYTHQIEPNNYLAMENINTYHYLRIPNKISHKLSELEQISNRCTRGKLCHFKNL
jgi:hypothetical protein